MGQVPGIEAKGDTFHWTFHGRNGRNGRGREVWILEMIGKGHVEKGAVWVAVRVPDGHVSGHANQARIQQFPLHDADHCVYSSDAGSPR